MAERREPIEDAEEVTATLVNDGGPNFSAADLALPRLRIVGKDAQLVELGVAKPMDLAIGEDAEDEDSTIYPHPGSLRMHVITWRYNYGCGYGKQEGQWDEGDPEMPACAKKQYHYTLFIPDYDRVMPVLYTASGGMAKVMRGVNTKIARNGMDRPYEQAFELVTFMKTGNPGGNGQKSWPAGKIALIEANPDDVKIAQGLYEALVGSPRTQLSSGSTPGF